MANLGTQHNSATDRSGASGAWYLALEDSNAVLKIAESSCIGVDGTGNIKFGVQGTVAAALFHEMEDELWVTPVAGYPRVRQELLTDTTSVACDDILEVSGIQFRVTQSPVQSYDLADDETQSDNRPAATGKYSVANWLFSGALCAGFITAGIFVLPNL